MTDYKEEQMMEVEALESIYMDEFTKLTEDPLSYQIHIVPNQDGQNNHVALTLKVAIPATYPDAEPKLDVALDKGLSDTQYKEIKQLLEQQIEECAGMAMIFTICEAVREYLVKNNREGNDGSEYQEMMRRMEIRKKKDDQEEAANRSVVEAATDAKRDFVGTPVTVETFAAWREKFEREMRGDEKTSLKDEATAKLTGKMLWTKGLVKDEDTEKADEDDDENDEDYQEDEDGKGNDDDDDA